MNTQLIPDDELHAYVDDCLPAARRQRVEALLAEDPAAADTVRAYRAQNVALQALFAPVLDEPLPAALAARAVAPAASPRLWSRWSLQRLAAGVLIALLGGAAGWLGHDYMLAARPAEIASLPRQAAVAHVVFSPDVRRPVEIGAEQQDQLVTWLSKRMGTPVRPPKLGALGYDLIGGRLLPGNSGPVAQFMYQDASGQRLTLYVSTENPRSRDTAFRFAQEGAVNVFYWVDGKFGYALSASVPKSELAKVATLVYDQLEKLPKE